MDLKIRELEVFRAIMETGSVTEAALSLHVTQPAISKMLQQTEDRLGFALFMRRRGHLTPTAEAHALLPEAMKAGSAIQSVERLAEDLKTVRSGVLTLAAAPALCVSILPAAIRRFRTERQDVTVMLQSASNHEVSRLVAEHQVDLGLVLSPTEGSSTLSRDLCGSTLACVMPLHHPLEKFSSVQPGD